MSTQEPEVLPVSTPRPTTTDIMEVPPDDGSLHGASRPASGCYGPAVAPGDPSVNPRADGNSIHRQSLWNSGRGSPAILQDEAEETGDDLPGSTTEPEKGDPGCRGKKGYVYPFKLNPEERYPIKDPASYTEFEKRYPPDRFGEEASDNARVWKLYRDRVTERDDDQIEGWNKTLDILLIFAGLFSAVATAFIIEAYKQLQPDYTQIMAKAFLASLNGTAAAAEVASLSQFSRPPLARCVNTLWFLSLTLALVVALLAILAKQWIGEYTSRMSRHISSQRRWAWRHLVYHAGLEKWGMDTFISALPLMLHLSLMLFLVGLAAFLTDLDWVIVAFVLALTVAVVVFYVCATVAPLWFGDCPTATPILDQARRALESLHMNLLRHLLSIRKRVGHRLRIRSWREAETVSTSWNPPAYDEKVLLKTASARQDAMSLRWMVTSLPAVEEIDVALDAVGSLDPLEHRHEFHVDSNGVASDDPAEGDNLCLGPVLIAATTRFQRLCEGAAGSDDAAVARCIRTLLALSVKHYGHIQLPEDSKSAARHLLNRWAAVQTHDLHFLCSVFGDYFHSYENRSTLHVVQAWTDDAGPVTGQTPFLPSSIALCFLHRKHRFAGDATSTALIYSTLSASVACLASDPARRRTALNILHDAAVVYSQEVPGIELTKARSSMDTLQQLYFRAMSTIGLLRNTLPNDATEDMHPILSTNFARLVSTCPGVETLTIEHISYARGVLDMTPHFRPEDDGVVNKLFELIRDYLRRLTDWSDDAGETTRRFIELYASSPSTIDTAASLAFWLSERSHDNIFSTSEMAVRHSLVNLLLPGTKGEVSAWRTLCNTSSRSVVAYLSTIQLANTLASLLITLTRRGFDVTILVEEFLGDGRLYNLMSARNFQDSVHLAQHARELSPGWWEDTKTRLQSLASVHDSGSSDLLVEGNDGGSIVMPSAMTDFVRDVDAFDGHCQTCDFDKLKWEEATQNAVDSGQKNASVSLLARAYHQARRAVKERSWRGRSALISDAEAHEFPVTAPPPMAPHASHTSLARPSVTSAHDEPV